MLAGLGHALAILDDRRAALQVARDLKRLRADKGLFAYELGVIHAALGDRDETVSLWVKEVETRTPTTHALS